MRRGSSQAENICRRVKAQDKMGKAIKLGGQDTRKIALNLYGIDIDVEKEEAEDSLKRILNLPSENQDIEVRALRPMVGGRRAATILAKPELAKTLAAIGKVRIGISVADVKERKDMKRCNKCWQEGHFERECKGEDRKNLCRNCGKPNHVARDCRERPACILCDTIGHRTASRFCKFRQGGREEAEAPSVLTQNQAAHS
ncbi:hypothetical protein WA026_014766 [Henosepilachna vigintioctopunctata]|uniref:CCHC-type domain-containing protein n=1 Tax=Henosepilachna vigintioctopunctata TaxID=420089 RepID=A0AAW1VEC4_9CUCU